MEEAIGWWRPMVESLPLATPASTGPPVRFLSTDRSSAWRQLPMVAVIGWWRPRGGSLPLATPATPGPPLRSLSPVGSWDGGNSRWSRLLASGVRWRDLLFRRRRLRRVHRWASAQQADRGDGGNSRWWRLLAGGVRRWDLQLR